MALPVLAASLAASAPAFAQDAAKPAAPAAKPVEAAAPAPDPGGKITVTGLADFYYQYSFNHPAPGSLLTGRSFDVKSDSFSLSLLELNVVRTASKAFPIALTATFTLGKTADLVHATEPGTNNIKYLQQLYGSYTTEGKLPVTIDVGKFVTWTGYEVIESTGNDNYSRGLLFNYAIPFYHMGVRATAPLTKKVTAGLYLVNGWNNAEDDNGGKSIGASLAFTPSSTSSIIFNYLGGDESTGAALPANLNVQLLDVVATLNLTPKFKLGANVDYASAAKPGTPSGHWNGQAIYGKYQITGANAFTVRGEHFEDSNGLRTGFAQNINEVTATFEHVWKTNLVTRFEFRHDHAGVNLFPSNSGPGVTGIVPFGGSKNQDTFTLAQIVKF